MRAMILAAGRGERLRPLTDSCPKPLLKVNGKALIEYHLEALSQAGVQEVVINVCYLGEQIKQALGDGKRWGLSIHYCVENPVLETGGGILNALTFLGEAPFIVLSADIFTNFCFKTLIQKGLAPAALAHLVVVDNAEYPGDFGLENNQIIASKDYTYANIGLYRSELFKDCIKDTVFPLAPLLHSAVAKGLITGECYKGPWSNIGTQAQLNQAQSTPLGVYSLRT